MRKLHPWIAAACACAITAAACVTASAQTTFASSNDHTASLRVERTADLGTVVILTRAHRDPQPAPFSERTILRDPATGIGYDLRRQSSRRSKDGRTETVRAVFRLLDADVETFDLMDPHLQQQALYISQIRDGEVVTASADY